MSYSFITGLPSWLQVINGTASILGGITTGSDQQLTYKTVSINPNVSEREAIVTVKAGNMQEDVVIRQAGSEFRTTDGEAKIAGTGGSTTGAVTATDGLAWTISPETHNGITVSPIFGSGSETLTFTSLDNPGLETYGNIHCIGNGCKSSTFSHSYSHTGGRGESLCWRSSSM